MLASPSSLAGLLWPMVRTVADVAQTLEVIAGKDPLDPRQYEVPVQSYTAALGRDLRGVRIGLLQEMPGQGGVGN
jgi:Asp-tRNA(Asn)/Glu-tRNA(Gln) amidotransferase A subunit family amidase